MGLVVDVTLVGLLMELVVRATLVGLFVGAMLVALVVGLLAGTLRAALRAKPRCAEQASRFAPFFAQSCSAPFHFRLALAAV